MRRFFSGKPCCLVVARQVHGHCRRQFPFPEHSLSWQFDIHERQIGTVLPGKRQGLRTGGHRAENPAAEIGENHSEAGGEDAVIPGDQQGDGVY